MIDFNLNWMNFRRTDPQPWDAKPTKIQTIFQLSVIALAFLAFAGYLLCMIVQAIKSKGKQKHEVALSYFIRIT